MSEPGSMGFKGWAEMSQLKLWPIIKIFPEYFSYPMIPLSLINQGSDNNHNI